MNERPHVFRTPLLILLALVVSLALLIHFGLPLWVAHEEKVSDIPHSGTYVCEELCVSIPFVYGKDTILTLPDGTEIEVGIEHSRRMVDLHDKSITVVGVYEAHLEEGYIEITFDSLPVPFDADRPYRFVKGQIPYA